MPTITINLSTLDADKLTTLKGRLKIYNKTLDEYVEAALTNFITSTENDLTDIGYCPHCFLTSQGTKTPLKGMPISKAEEKGIISLGSDAARNFALENDVFYVTCSTCFWWGYPNKANLTE